MSLLVVVGFVLLMPLAHAVSVDFTPASYSLVNGEIELRAVYSDTQLNASFYYMGAAPPLELIGTQDGPATEFSMAFDTTTIEDGTYIFRVESYDEFLLENSVSSINITVDNTAPSLEISLPEDGISYPYADILVEYATDADYCRYELDGEETGIPDCGAIELSLADGPHSITVYAEDLAGNVNSSAIDFIVDTVSPVVSLVSPDDSLLTNDASIDFACSAQDNGLASITLYGSWDVWQAIETRPMTGDGQATFTIEVPDGAHEWNCLAEDSAGNSDFAGSNQSIVVDTEAPLITLSMNESVLRSGSAMEISWSVSDANMGSRRLVVSGPDGTMLQESTDDTSSLVVSPTETGNYTVDVYATDAAGNEAAYSASFLVTSSIFGGLMLVSAVTIASAIVSVLIIVGAYLFFRRKKSL